MSSEKELIMFYQTTLRNVGLYTSISLAALGYSRFYRGKNRLYNVAFILISLALLSVSIYIARLLLLDINDSRTNDMMMIKKWIQILYYIIGINCIVGLFGVLTLYREMIKKD